MSNKDTRIGQKKEENNETEYVAGLLATTVFSCMSLPVLGSGTELRDNHHDVSHQSLLVADMGSS